jgi:hypothetical protein
LGELSQLPLPPLPPAGLLLLVNAHRRLAVVGACCTTTAIAGAPASFPLMSQEASIGGWSAPHPFSSGTPSADCAWACACRAISVCARITNAASGASGRTTAGVQCAGGPRYE